MKIVCYYPPITPQTSFPTWEPLQFVYLRRALRHRGIDMQLVDGRIDTGPERIKKLIEFLNVDTLCLAVTSLTCYQIVDAIETISAIKQVRTDISVVLGGWHATILADETLRESSVDYIVRGQGEFTFNALLDCLEAGRKPYGIAGLSWKDGIKIVHEAERPIGDLNTLPLLSIADFDFLNLKYYQIKETLFYMSSIGCPYSCRYCCIKAQYSHTWNALSAERVIAELKELYDHFGFGKLIFWDNVFFVNKERVRTICEGLLSQRIKVNWSAHGRINEIITWDDDFLSLLRQSGCQSIFIGIESGSQRVLDAINKKICTRDVLPVFNRLKMHGINVDVNYMVGLPGETHHDVKETVASVLDGLRIFNNDLNIFKVNVYRYVPFPKTSLFNALPPHQKSTYPRGSLAWGKYIHDTVNDGFLSLENLFNLKIATNFNKFKNSCICKK
ncbi:MAG: B12-binding domain-containing radical SAM protein [Desulfobacterales bacterium]|nr:B12-binding domain-containing radical SAM protein [Desulfobacterales bacterium]